VWLCILLVTAGSAAYFIVRGHDWAGWLIIAADSLVALTFLTSVITRFVLDLVLVFHPIGRHAMTVGRRFGLCLTALLLGWTVFLVIAMQLEYRALDPILSVTFLILAPVAAILVMVPGSRRYWSIALTLFGAAFNTGLHLYFSRRGYVDPDIQSWGIGVQAIAGVLTVTLLFYSRR
jgi:hypothetical protein